VDLARHGIRHASHATVQATFGFGLAFVGISGFALGVAVSFFARHCMIHGVSIARYSAAAALLAK
jgi:hypothetical protein